MCQGVFGLCEYLKYYFINSISKLLYKNTVELSMVMNVLSAIADVDNDTLKKLRVKCMNEVKATNGKISFEEINKYQKGS